MRFEDFVGLRYLMAKRDRNMLSVITLISVGGVAIGVMALIVVLSVMSGFETEFREQIIGSKAHVVISAVDGYIENYDEIRSIAKSVDHVEGVSVFVEAEIMLNSPTNLQAAILRGVDYREITTTTKLASYMSAKDGEENKGEGKLEYLENPDALPTIGLSNSFHQSGSLIIHQEAENGELSEADKQQGLKTGAQSAVAFTGHKHGLWISKGNEEVEMFILPDDKSDTTPETTPDPTQISDTTAEPVPAPRTDNTDTSDDDIDPELLALIGEDKWVDDAPNAVHRSAPADLNAMANQRQPNAELLPQKTRSRQMKALPGLGDDDIGNRKVGAIILGSELKKNLGLYLGGEVNVMSPSGDLGPTGGMPKSRPFKLVGTYHSGMFDFDAKMGYISLEQAQSLLGIGDRISGIDVRCTQLEDSKIVRDTLREKLKNYDNIRVDDWRTLNSSLFSAIMLEKVAMFTILTSIILVASFNILCLLIMMVIDKAREIAIFKAMGTTDASIVRIFVIQGLVIGVLGTLIGLIFGLSLCWIIAILKPNMPGDAHYTTVIPVAVQALDVCLICVASVCISMLATILPSRMAVKLKAVDGLRCE